MKYIILKTLAVFTYLITVAEAQQEQPLVITYGPMQPIQVYLQPTTVTITATIYVTQSQTPTSSAPQPTSKPPPPPPASPPKKNKQGIAADWKQQTLDAVNLIREKYKAPPLKLNAELSKLAQAHSDVIKKMNRLTHDDPGGKMDARLARMGVNVHASAENIAQAGEKQNMTKIVDLYLNDSAHLGNMISNKYDLLGLGVNVPYWTMDFASFYNKR